MPKLGMDSAEVHGLAARLDEQARVLQGIVGSVDGLVQRISADWHGADGQRFCNDWRVQFRPAMVRAHDSVAGLATAAHNNATEQESASGLAGAYAWTAFRGGPSGPTRPPTIGQIFHGLADTWNGTTTPADRTLHRGPYLQGSTAGHASGIPWALGADAYAGYGGTGHTEVSIGLKGASAAADGRIYAGAGADGHYSVGNKYWTASGAGHVFHGYQASGSASAQVGFLGTKLDASGGASAGGSADATMYSGNQFVNQTVTGHAFGGAEAQGDAFMHNSFGNWGVGAHGKALIGAEASADSNFDVGGMHATVGAGVMAGIGVKGGGDVSVNLNDLGGDVDLAAALGLGFELKGGVHIQPVEVANDVGTAFSGGWHAVTHPPF